jgi:hypothetical protein
MEVCFKDQSGQLPGKSIVFAMTHPHAQRLRLVFEQMYPQFKDLVEVITSDTERVTDSQPALRSNGKNAISLVSFMERSRAPLCPLIFWRRRILRLVG